MRIVLQQMDTGLYFQDIGSWTREHTQAMDFVSSSKAIEFCVANKLDGVHLVLKFDQQEHEIVLPIAAGAEVSNRRNASPF